MCIKTNNYNEKPHKLRTRALTNTKLRCDRYTIMPDISWKTKHTKNGNRKEGHKQVLTRNCRFIETHENLYMRTNHKLKKHDAD